MEEQKKRRGFHLTMFNVIVLVILVCAVLGIGGKKTNPLMQDGVSTTLYVHTDVGVQPEISIASMIKDDKLDESRVTYDFGGCDVGRPGKYLVPVLYDGKETSFVIEVEVGEEELHKPEVMDSDDRILAPPAG